MHRGLKTKPNSLKYLFQVTAHRREWTFAKWDFCKFICKIVKHMSFANFIAGYTMQPFIPISATAHHRETRIPSLNTFCLLNLYMRHLHKQSVVWHYASPLCPFLPTTLNARVLQHSWYSQVLLIFFKNYIGCRSSSVSKSQWIRRGERKLPYTYVKYQKWVDLWRAGARLQWSWTQVHSRIAWW